MRHCYVNMMSLILTCTTQNIWELLVVDDHEFLHGQKLALGMEVSEFNHPTLSNPYLANS